MRLVEEIRHELAMRVDPVYREGCRKFFKEDVEPLGVRSADLKAAEFIPYKQLKPLPRQERLPCLRNSGGAANSKRAQWLCHIGHNFKREFSLTEFNTFERWIDRH